MVDLKLIKRLRKSFFRVIKCSRYWQENFKTLKVGKVVGVAAIHAILLQRADRSCSAGPAQFHVYFWSIATLYIDFRFIVTAFT